jgi:hypothetical protein
MKISCRSVVFIAFLGALVLSACNGTTEDPMLLGAKPQVAEVAPAAALEPVVDEACTCAVAPAVVPGDGTTTPAPDPGPGPTPGTTCPTDCPSPPVATTPTPVEREPFANPFVDPFRAGGDAACPGNTQLPAGCILLGGTTLEDARWLQCHRNRGNNCSEFCCWLTGPVLASCDLTQAQVDQIAADCATGTPAERMKCAGDKVKAALEGTGSVCRHHTRCMNFVLAAMGLPTDLETSTTHAWTEVPSSPSGTYIIDAYNNIYYWCP